MLLGNTALSRSKHLSALLESDHLQFIFLQLLYLKWNFSFGLKKFYSLTVLSDWKILFLMSEKKEIAEGIFLVAWSKSRCHTVGHLYFIVKKLPSLWNSRPFGVLIEINNRLRWTGGQQWFDREDCSGSTLEKVKTGGEVGNFILKLLLN